MTNKDIHLRIDNKLSNIIETQRIANNEQDQQDTIRRIIIDYTKNKNSFLIRLKNLFKF